MNIIETVKQIFEELQATSSKTEKEQIIRRNSHMELFKQTLNFILNPYITTGLSDKKMNKVVSSQPTVNLRSPKEAMDYLRRNNTGTDEIISVVQSFISQQPEDMKDFYKAIFTKSIKLGCAANTVTEYPYSLPKYVSEAICKNFLKETMGKTANGDLYITDCVISITEER